MGRRIRHLAQARRKQLGTLITIAGDMTGDEARAIRIGLGLSARQVAEECGTTESSIYRWEWRRDQSVPRMYERALRDLVREVRRRQRNDPPEECTG